MFYHDHAYGITRLNVYAGEAAGYLLTDSTENTLQGLGVLPGAIPVNLATGAPNLGAADLPHLVPLIIQDKTFVPADINIQDNAWNPWRTANGIAGGVPGDLWFPHKYEPNQDPTILSGASLFGRWDYGPWFWPPTANITYPPVPNEYYLEDGALLRPATPNISTPMEAFQDTPVVNGMAYPFLDVEPKAYRFRILNAADDRFFNLQMYQATSIISSITITTQAAVIPRLRL